jgi:hypothetical protein
MGYERWWLLGFQSCEKLRRKLEQLERLLQMAG